MIFLSILIALILERVTPQFVEIRNFRWLRDYSQWMVAVLHIERFGAWMGLAVLIFPIMVVVWIMTGMFENALFGLFELAFDVAVIFFCLGPKELDSQVDGYLDAIEVGDTQQRFKAASQLTTEAPSMELPVQVIQVCKSIYVEANSRVFAVLFWFVLFGPVAAIVYRVFEQFLTRNYLENSLDSVKQLIKTVFGWIDWLPTRITLFSYMVSGNFEEGLQIYRSGNVVAVDMVEQNKELLQAVGYQSIASHEVSDDSHAMDLIRKSRGLFLRSLVVWLLLVLFFSFVG
ncbi:MAG: regulatory signaling modulator protein AmpE [Gammaproteobacteria bacterium]|jgi:membrane protein required for beta-lactamase induction|nr:regulatory signaling modulator protein AmpE [Gammaproteobacteria bacterium]MBT3722446.1 regulatory signaling modulator protein AmpE [Gammaproteobacteria bacterium]MBT4196541.1 regulatory signaling modulator protein AmpE [Gammaproteobacteria bacterium]MBT4450227.1 regulatory signaling modulator protein AmpE [Gammaproteobacteria bacterium]MBT4861698.1 regulatory signaling modulator protein AmpE [Gammaproteobacteria bacterium]